MSYKPESEKKKRYRFVQHVFTEILAESEEEARDQLFTWDQDAYSAELIDVLDA